MHGNHEALGPALSALSHKKGQRKGASYRHLPKYAHAPPPFIPPPAFNYALPPLSRSRIPLPFYPRSSPYGCRGPSCCCPQLAHSPPTVANVWKRLMICCHGRGVA